MRSIVRRAELAAQIASITPEQLLGRKPAVFPGIALRSFLNAKRVLVTGGGGSIGAQLCREVARCRPSRLVVLDICENSAFELREELALQYKDGLSVGVVIASVRDRNRIDQVFARERPELVFHAAAHKHVPLMEAAPQEAVKNNLLGTRNVACAAAEWGVSRFVLISTDKAVNPAGVMGATKRLAEQVVQLLNSQSPTIFTVARFGNVLGTSGSVMGLFKKQIAAGGPVCITHPMASRFFMTVSEAAGLVLTAASLARGGEVFVLEMGLPVRIEDLARRMISLSGLTVGRDIEICYTGLRPGEKLTEELCLPGEAAAFAVGRRLRVTMPPLPDSAALTAAVDDLTRLAEQNNEAALLDLFCSLFGSFDQIRHA